MAEIFEAVWADRQFQYFFNQSTAGSKPVERIVTTRGASTGGSGGGASISPFSITFTSKRAG
jgi:hypothetical protein